MILMEFAMFRPFLECMLSYLVEELDVMISLCEGLLS